jgi:hypothetical protein
MELLVGNDWMRYFDVVIVQARKPKFFTDESRPFRIYDYESQTQLWDRVTRLEKGKVYYEVRKMFYLNELQHFSSVITVFFNLFIEGFIQLPPSLHG